MIVGQMVVGEGVVEDRRQLEVEAHSPAKRGIAGTTELWAASGSVARWGVVSGSMGSATIGVRQLTMTWSISRR